MSVALLLISLCNTFLLASNSKNVSSETVPSFEDNFCDSTLRVDYIFGGGPAGVTLMLDAQSKSAGWAGRRNNLDKLPLAGNGVVEVLDPATGARLYANPFSTLFQEWLAIDEANETQRSFENSFQVPLPRHDADIRVTLYNNRHEEIASLTHKYKPTDELVAIRRNKPLPHQYLHRAADPANAIDIAILAEGYTEAEMDSFLVHAKKSADEILSYEPFATYADKINFVAVMSPSTESGVSIPSRGDWRDTAFGSHFSTFHMERYLTVPNVKRLFDALTGIPFEHIMILVNTDKYGGGGIYNSYHIATALNDKTLPVTVHEFGHSFAGLADEYFYEGDEMEMYPTDIEPWEKNITTLVDFDSKWKDMVPAETPVPTPWNAKSGTREETIAMFESGESKDTDAVGVYEGGGYRTHGVYRPAVTCRMRDNYHPSFCPVCQRAIAEMIEFYTR